MKKLLIVGTAALLLGLSSNSSAWWGNNGWGNNDWPVWTPMYWAEEMVDGNSYGPYNYGGYSPYGYGPNNYGRYGYGPYNYNSYGYGPYNGAFPGNGFPGFPGGWGW